MRHVARVSGGREGRGVSTRSTPSGGRGGAPAIDPRPGSGRGPSRAFRNSSPYRDGSRCSVSLSLPSCLQSVVLCPSSKYLLSSPLLRFFPKFPEISGELASLGVG